MIYLDTHVVVWLYAGDVQKLSSNAYKLINENDLFISQIVLLELQYLFEIQRITEKASIIYSDLSDRIDLKTCNKDFNTIVAGALEMSWTRDPFDRIIVSNAAIDSNVFVSKDQHILENYKHAIW